MSVGFLNILILLVFNIWYSFVMKFFWMEYGVKGKGKWMLLIFGVLLVMVLGGKKKTVVVECSSGKFLDRNFLLFDLGCFCCLDIFLRFLESVGVFFFKICVSGLKLLFVIIFVVFFFYIL